MTFKAVVRYLIETDAKDWITELFNSNGIEFRWMDVELKEMDNEPSNFLWTCHVSVVTQDYQHINLDVGGTADDLIGIAHSVIWDEKHRIIWMSSETTREMLGIDSLKIA